MIGKVRGFLLLFIFFMVVAVGAAVIGFGEAGDAWDSVRSIASEAFPMGEDEARPSSATSGSTMDGAEFLTSAAMTALKEGKAKPGDILELGQMYVKARSDGHLDEQEASEIFELADRAGIMDVVIDKALEPTGSSVTTIRPANDFPVPIVRRSGGDVGAELRSLMTEVEIARADGNLNPGEMMALLQKARDSGIQERILSMVPPDYDDARARSVARNLAKAMISGRTNMQEANSIVNLFIQAQEDGRLEHQELDRITSMAERLSL